MRRKGSGCAGWQWLQLMQHLWGTNALCSRSLCNTYLGNQAPTNNSYKCSEGYCGHVLGIFSVLPPYPIDTLAIRPTQERALTPAKE
jgi:hypothetical protein